MIWVSPGWNYRSTALAGILEVRQNYCHQLVNWLEARFDQLDSDSQQRFTTNPLRLLDSKNSTTQALLADGPTLVEARSKESSQRFEAVQ